MAKTSTQFDELLCVIGLRSSNWGLFVQKVLKYIFLQTDEVIVGDNITSPFTELQVMRSTLNVT